MIYGHVVCRTRHTYTPVGYTYALPQADVMYGAATTDAVEPKGSTFTPDPAPRGIVRHRTAPHPATSGAVSYILPRLILCEVVQVITASKGVTGHPGFTFMRAMLKDAGHLRFFDYKYYY